MDSLLFLAYRKKLRTCLVCDSAEPRLHSFVDIVLSDGQASTTFYAYLRSRDASPVRSVRPCRNVSVHEPRRSRCDSVFPTICQSRWFIQNVPRFLWRGARIVIKYSPCDTWASLHDFPAPPEHSPHRSTRIHSNAVVVPPEANPLSRLVDFINVHTQMPGNQNIAKMAL